jgi:hypothetical protein
MEIKTITNNTYECPLCKRTYPTKEKAIQCAQLGKIEDEGFEKINPGMFLYSMKNNYIFPCSRVYRTSDNICGQKYLIDSMQSNDSHNIIDILRNYKIISMEKAVSMEWFPSFLNCWRDRAPKKMQNKLKNILFKKSKKDLINLLFNRKGV